MTDPISDMLSRVRNGYLAKKRVVELPYSKTKENLGKILLKEGFLRRMEIKGQKPTERKIILGLKYPNKKPVLTGIKRISKPGLRIYARAGKIPPIRVGFGFSIVSTSKGLMTDYKAKKKNLGGEIICQVW